MDKAPVLLIVGLVGIDYIKNPSLSFFILPLTISPTKQKTTIVDL